MNHHHRKTLHALFAHPISANIDFKKVVHLLEGIGAEVDNKPGNRVGVKLNEHSAALGTLTAICQRKKSSRCGSFLKPVGSRRPSFLSEQFERPSTAKDLACYSTIGSG